MCQQTEIGLKIEQLCRQGMPRKVGKRMENTFLKKMNSANSEQSQNIENSEMNKNLDIPVLDADFLRRHLSLKLGPNVGKSGKGGDILAVGTQWTRKFAQIIAAAVNLITKSDAYKTLSRTTQPAHVIAIGILTFVLFAVWPSLLETKDTSNTDRKSGLALVAYLGAFATHFGTQIWMTFVSGLSLYFALPRHTFGQCQQILFPKYFAMNSILSICTLILFIKAIGGRWEFASYVQVIALTLCAVIEVAVRLYLAPPLLRLMSEKHKFEISFGSGQEIGHLDQKDLVKCPHYQKIHKSFRRIHMTVGMGNLTTLLCTFMHLHYLASRISVS